MKVKAIKGFKDILPGEVEKWQWLEDWARELFDRYGFSEIRLPVLEKTDLFARSIGSTSDIVSKEMYTFEDRDRTLLTLRPEATASVVRAFVEHHLHASQSLTKLFYIGPMFRHEQPQKGRLRQFSQIGVEALGVDDPLLDAEIVAMLKVYLDACEVRALQYEINTLGCMQCRPAYIKKLTKFLQGIRMELCQDCQRRAELNPLRCFDCKKEDCKALLKTAPMIGDHHCRNCRDHFHVFQNALDKLGVPFVINPQLVRGLDYYTKTAFEVTSSSLGAQNAVAAGGRYDTLVQEMGGEDTPGFGFALGMERLISLLPDDDRWERPMEVFVAVLEDDVRAHAFEILQEIRSREVRADMAYHGKSLKAQMRQANKMKARYVIILGGEEFQRGKTLVRDMENSQQEEMDVSLVSERIVSLLSKNSG